MVQALFTFYLTKESLSPSDFKKSLLVCSADLQNNMYDCGVNLFCVFMVYFMTLSIAQILALDDKMFHE
jgi:Ulp1 family protease